METLKNNTLICILGTTHKTDVIINFIPSWIKNNPKGEMIVFDPMAIIIPTFNEHVKYFIDNDEEFKWVDVLIKKYKGKRGIPKLLVLNGGDILFPKPTVDKLNEDFPELSRTPRLMCHKKFQDLLCMKRVLNMDIIITFQTPDAMPIVVENFVNNFIILPILEEYEITSKSPWYSNMKMCIEAINYYHNNHSKNTYKEYVSISTEKDEIVVNDAIDEKIFNEIIEKFKPVNKKSEIEI